MRPKIIVVIVASFLLLVAVATASASVNSPMTLGVSWIANQQPTTGAALISSFVMIASPDSDKGRSEEARAKHEKHQNHGKKNEFHGAEMTPGMMLLAGILGVAAYFGVRRYSHRNV